MSRPSTEEGAASVLVAALLGVTALLVVGLGRVGGAAVARGRVDAVADLVALASVTGGAEGAQRVAAADGAVLFGVAGSPSGRQTVTVQIAGVTSSATAAPSPDGQSVIPG